MAVSAAPQDSSSAGDTLPPGTPLLQGQYLVEGYLNSGGFGVTYLARDSLERRVVLKECYPASMCCRAGGVVRARSHANQSEFETVVRLFGQEARRLARLEHPNIVGVRDVFEENGTAYMALDYIDGRDLHDVIEQETWRLDPDTVREIAVQLLDAIGHVHGMGMLHRDISPDNILLTHDDTPILIDFGAARDSAWRKSRVLSTLHVVKDGYSPQEFYLQAGEQSPASDLYSLAASLYRAITGDPPVFSHRRLAAIAERRPDPYVPLEGTADGYDAAFLRMIDTALAVFARDRVQSAADWLAGIERAAPPEAADPGAPLPAPTMDDAVIVERVRRLVEATNPEVQALHAERTRELEERARCEAEERAAQEAARCRRLEEARREAEEAERAYRERQRQESEARRAVPAPAPGAASDEQEAVVPQGDAEVPHVPGAGGVNRAKLLKERVERARREREQAETAALSREDGSGGPAGRTSRGSLFGLMLGGGWLRPATRDASSKEGFGA